MRRASALVVFMSLFFASLDAAPAGAYISKPDALERTFHFAKVACNRDRHCHRYGAIACLRHNGGVSCAGWNYEIYNHKRVSCKKIYFWRGRHSRPKTSGWNCRYRGWHWGPYK